MGNTSTQGELNEGDYLINGGNDLKIGLELKYLRHLLNLKQKNISYILNIPQQTISRIENNEKSAVSEYIIYKYRELIDYVMLKKKEHLRTMQIVVLDKIRKELDAFLMPLNTALIDEYFHKN